MVEHLSKLIESQELVGQEFSAQGKTFKLVENDNFEYIDPVDGSVSKKQGIRFHFEDGSRLVFRLSGTGSSGATIRLYCDSYEGPTGNISGNPQDVLKAIVEIALKISELKEFTGREEPTVIT